MNCKFLLALFNLPVRTNCTPTIYNFNPPLLYKHLSFVAALWGLLSSSHCCWLYLVLFPATMHLRSRYIKYKISFLRRKELMKSKCYSVRLCHYKALLKGSKGFLKLPQMFIGDPREFPVSIQRLRDFQNCLKRASRELQESIKRASRELQGSFKEASREFQDSFKRVSREL